MSQSLLDGPVDLDDMESVAAQFSTDADAVARGPLDADGLDRPMAGEPADCQPVTGLRGRELLVGDLGAEGGDQRDVDGVFV